MMREQSIKEVKEQFGIDMKSWDVKKLTLLKNYIDELLWMESNK
jgi:hypothetical protein